MRTFSAIFWGGLIVVVYAGFSQADEQTKPVPLMKVETPIYEFDQVSQGEVIEHKFRVFNRGESTLVIKKVKPG